MAVTHESLIDWLDREAGVDVEPLEGDTLLFSTSVVDSFDLVDLMVFIENEAQIKFNPLDVNLENLDSINRILAFVARRTAEASAG
ncbi:MAG: acyl carrier protein [Myxococcota bacterium]